jgi:integrase
MLRGETLLEHLERYFLRRQLASASQYQHRHVLALFCHWLGRDPPLRDCDDDLVNAFLQDAADRYAAATVRRFRIYLGTSLRSAARDGLAQWPIHLRRIRVPDKLPEAWTIQQVRQLLDACPGVRHGDWLDAMIRVIWDTGLRCSDARQLAWEEIDRRYVMMRKTGQPLLIRLRPETLAALRQLPARDRPLDRGSPRQHYVWWRALCLAAGVPHGGPQRLRRSAATYVELEHPGAATAFLGHKSSDLARRHYLDPRILGQQPAQPQPL